MTRIFGFILLIISIYLITQSLTTAYYDYDKNKIAISNDETKNVYAEVDNIGFVLAIKEIQRLILPIVFLVTLILTGFLVTIFPNKFPLNRFDDVKLKNFGIILLIIFIIFISQYIKYFNWSAPPGGFSGPAITLVKFIFVTLILTIIISVFNRKDFKFLIKEYSVIWLLLASVMLANGLLVETYSWSGGSHHGNFAQFDYLGIAKFVDWSHNWTFGYTVFRSTNNLLMILGLLIISVVASKSKKLHTN